jgi:hypothetical protein
VKGELKIITDITVRSYMYCIKCVKLRVDGNSTEPKVLGFFRSIKPVAEGFSTEQAFEILTNFKKLLIDLWILNSQKPRGVLNQSGYQESRFLKSLRLDQWVALYSGMCLLEACLSDYLIIKNNIWYYYCHIRHETKDQGRKPPILDSSLSFATPSKRLVSIKQCFKRHCALRERGHSSFYFPTVQFKPTTVSVQTTDWTYTFSDNFWVQFSISKCSPDKVF